MQEGIDITVENKLKKEERGINVYHHSTRSTHIISCNSTIAVPLKTVDEDDYLHISAVRGPGNLRNVCLVDLPSWVDFECSAEGKVTLNRRGDRTLLKIPPGPPTWQLEITRSTEYPFEATPSYVTIGNRE